LPGLPSVAKFLAVMGEGSIGQRAMLFMGGTPPMNKNLVTMLVDFGIMLLLVALSFGLWYSPWITVLLIGLFLLGGFLFGRHSGID